ERGRDARDPGEAVRLHGGLARADQPPPPQGCPVAGRTCGRLHEPRGEPAQASSRIARPLRRRERAQGRPGWLTACYKQAVSLVPLRKSAHASPRDARRFLPTTREEMR